MNEPDSSFGSRAQARQESEESDVERAQGPAMGPGPARREPGLQQGVQRRSAARRTGPMEHDTTYVSVTSVRMCSHVHVHSTVDSGQWTVETADSTLELQVQLELSAARRPDGAVRVLTA